jgi:hypothetical protein
MHGNTCGEAIFHRKNQNFFALSPSLSRHHANSNPVPPSANLPRLRSFFNLWGSLNQIWQNAFRRAPEKVAAVDVFGHAPSEFN